MNMNCYNYPKEERAVYVSDKQGDLIGYFHVADEDVKRFLSEERVQAVSKILQKRDLSIDEMLDYLGVPFRDQWGMHRPAPEDFICKCECRIHSLDGELRETTIIKKTGDNQYLADYNGVKCTAIYNQFAGHYYVDDKYGVIKEPSAPDQCR
jgi:hypothetical protein